MALLPLCGHAEARRRLAAAIQSDRLPQVLLIEGPEGVGRQRLGLWLAQLIFCQEPGAEPCGRCRPCRLVQELSHPDLHWFIPVPRPKAGEPDKQVDEAAELIGQVIAERRGAPLYGPPEGLAIHGIASVRLLQRRAALTSVEGGPKVFVVGHAERLVPQESSQEAANALLKLLEEPTADTRFVLTATDARRLLPTIRSRVVPLRLGRLADAEVRGFLREHLSPAPAPAELEERVRLADGCIGLALGGAEAVAKAREAAADFVDAVLEGRERLMERVLKQGAFAARGDFSAMLDALAELLGEAARAATNEPTRLPLRGGLGRPRPVGRLLDAQRHVARAREAAAGNVNPQLLLGVLGDDLARCL